MINKIENFIINDFIQKMNNKNNVNCFFLSYNIFKLILIKIFKMNFCNKKSLRIIIILQFEKI